MKKILISAALPYINNVPHMGHMAGSHLPADIFARYCRQKGYDVTFVGGSDEHGTPSALAARNIGMEVKEYVDILHTVHKNIYKKMEISYDIYSRTSTPFHKEVTQDFFNNIDKKYLLEKEEELYYSEEDKMFLPDRFLIGSCPSCGYEEANSDQCDKCGKILSAKELIDPKSKLSGATPKLKKSKHIYLDLAKLSEKVDNWLESKKDSLKKHVFAEAKKWIKEGLRERSITRDLAWGVPVPVKGYEDKVFYVWFDAPIGYISFAKELGREDLWKDGEIYHFLGKDNIPFHTIFWPAMLIANSQYILPESVVGYNYLTFEGQKFSKSKNVGVFCYPLLKSDCTMDIDSLRFYIAASLPESKDADFKWNEYMQVVNSQLIGNVGNFFNRTISMTNKYLDGKIYLDRAPEDDILSEAKIDYPKIISESFEKGEIRNGLKKILEFSSLGNSFLERMEPWKMDKREDVEDVLYLCLDHARSISILMSAITPLKMELFWKEQLLLEDVPSKPMLWDLKERFPLKHKVGKPSPLYQRLDEDMIDDLKEQFSESFDISK